MEVIAIEFVTPLPSTKIGNSQFVVGVDLFSKITWASTVHVAFVGEAKNFLWSNLIVKSGVPLYILLDRGTHFLA